MKKMVPAIFLFAMAFQAGASETSAGPYRFDSAREWSIVGSGIALGAVGLYYDASKTRFTASDFEQTRRSNVPRIDRDYAGVYNGAAARRSDIWLAGSVLLPLTLIPANTDRTVAISAICAETALLVAGGVSFSKGVVDRHRPYSYGTGAPDDVRYSVDTKRSFFSGHAASITGGAVLTAVMFQDYYPRSEFVPWVWGGALGMAAYGSSLRVKAGMHFPSDVATGMLVGGSLAYFVPWLHRQPITRPMTLYANPDEIGLLWRWRLR